MYFTFGIQEIIRNQAILSQTVGSEVQSIGELRYQFWKFLNSTQDMPNGIYSDDVKIVSDSETAEFLSKKFSTDSVLNDKLQSEMFLQGKNSFSEKEVSMVSETLAAIDALDSGLSTAFRNNIYHIFFYDAEGAFGGTTSDAIGSIWIRKFSHLSVRDQIEFLVHEMTHNLFFIDERTQGHYVDYETLAMPETWRTSAILAERRPIDKCLHSILVAAEILLLRAQFLGHPTKRNRIHPLTQVLVKNTVNSIRSLTADGNKFLTERSYQVLNTVEREIKNV